MGYEDWPEGVRPMPVDMADDTGQEPGRYDVECPTCGGPTENGHALEGWPFEWQVASKLRDQLRTAQEENARLVAALFRHGMQRTCRRVLNEDGDVWRSLDADLEHDGHYCKEPSVGVVWMTGQGWRGFCAKHRPHERSDFILRSDPTPEDAS
jgi:hypothetical protein